MYFLFITSDGREHSTANISMEEFDAAAVEENASDAEIREAIAAMVDSVWYFMDQKYIRVFDTILNPAHIVSAQIIDADEFIERFPDLRWPSTQDS